MSPKHAAVDNIKIGMTFSYEPSMPLSDDLKDLLLEYENLTEEDEQSKHIYAVAGLALYWAQCFEMNLQQAIVGVEKFSHNTITTPEEYDLFDEKNSKMTMGRLLCEIRKVISVEKNIAELLEKALKKRNFLIHRFFKDYALDFMDTEGRKKMLSELLDYINLFKIADASIDCINRLFFNALGLTDPDIEKIIQEYKKMRTDGSAKSEALFKSLAQRAVKGEL